MTRMGSPRPTTEALWRLLSDRLRGFFRQRVADDQTADDLLQETFLRIHQRLDGLEQDDRVAAWVFQVARNLLVDHRRAARGRGDEELGGPDAGVADDVDDANWNAEVQSWLRPTIQALPETYRRAVELYELERVPQQAIADELGLSLSGAKSRVQRGRDKLVEALHECCAFELDRRGNVLDYTRREPGDCCSDDACSPG